MKHLSTVIAKEYEYDSEEERTNHVLEMESQEWECTGQVKKTDDSLGEANPKYYWYAKFYKY